MSNKAISCSCAQANRLAKKSSDVSVIKKVKKLSYTKHFC